MTNPKDAEVLAEALCQAQEAGQHLDQVAETTASHWRQVAEKALPFLRPAPSASDAELDRLEAAVGDGAWEVVEPDVISRLIALARVQPAPSASDARLREALADYRANPINAYDRPQSWQALAGLLDSCDAALSAVVPQEEER